MRPSPPATLILVSLIIMGLAVAALWIPIPNGTFSASLRSLRRFSVTGVEPSL